jgi:hypothetical protein
MPIGNMDPLKGRFLASTANIRLKCESLTQVYIIEALITVVNWFKVQAQSLHGATKG